MDRTHCECLFISGLWDAACWTQANSYRGVPGGLSLPGFLAHQLDARGSASSATHGTMLSQSKKISLWNCFTKLDDLLVTIYLLV